MRTWTKLDVRLLHQLAKEGAHLSVMIDELNRSEISIRKKLKLLGYTRKTTWVREYEN